MIILKDDFSDESFESTEESDATIDLTGDDGVTHKNFQNTEIVWAKRPALPWFPGIVSNSKWKVNVDRVLHLILFKQTKKHS